MKPEFKKDWVPSEGAFRRLLGWLDEGVDSGGEKYLEMRRRLAAYFDRRNCPSPDELADETLNRVARRLEEQGTISETPPARYCYIVARFVFLEYVRRARHESATLGERSGDSRSPLAGSDDQDGETSQRRLDSLVEDADLRPVANADDVPLHDHLVAGAQLEDLLRIRDREGDFVDRHG